ncbi:hypothetical protein GCM10028806_35050 [Spirosoma terrae]|uniref:EF-hand domain-containing protein n=1 Tax=Spirosoma terrae TaxID=1968276 RepID=A0A6L9LAI4_9BACT|nr:hypothetical protein [Spirosoma terrae]NDU97544.1 hypothetical protein [Spirosoma terrae]
MESVKSLKKKLSATEAGSLSGAATGLGAALGVEYTDKLMDDTSSSEPSELFPANDPALDTASGLVDSAPNKTSGDQLHTASHSTEAEDPEVIDGITYDTNGDGVADSIMFDLNGDGVIDAIVLDLDGDGVAEYAGIDTDNDHIADTHLIDINNDHTYDLAIHDSISGTTDVNESWQESNFDSYNGDDIAYDMNNDADISDWA